MSETTTPTSSLSYSSADATIICSPTGTSSMVYSPKGSVFAERTGSESSTSTNAPSIGTPFVASNTSPLTESKTGSVSSAETSPAVSIRPAISSMIIPIFIFTVLPPGNGLALITTRSGAKLALAKNPVGKPMGKLMGCRTPLRSGTGRSHRCRWPTLR